MIDHTTQFGNFKFGAYLICQPHALKVICFDFLNFVLKNMAWCFRSRELDKPFNIFYT